ncbi:MAG: protein translocase subunit SecD [Planctomycetota bacterium]
MIEANEIKGRFGIIFVVTALLVWAWLANGIRLGQDLKGGTTLRFSLDIEGAKKAGRIAADKDPDQVVTDTIAVIQDRVDRTGLSETQILPLGQDRFQISLPATAEGQAESVVGVVTQLGDLKFRIEALPDEQYAGGDDGSPPPRLATESVWAGKTEDSFLSFKRGEIERWRAARAAGDPYTPSNPRYYLVKAKGTDGSAESHFHVLEEPQNETDRQIGGTILTDPRVGIDPNNNQPVVLYEVKKEWQNRFGEWTGTNLYLPMAIVLNDEYWSAPRINGKLTDTVQISLGSGSRADLEKEAKQLVTVLQTGSLKIQPHLESENRVGASLAGDSRDRGLMAVAVAFLLVLVFMIVYYRGSGLVANFALLLNIVLLVGFLSFFKAVLTLPGIAGIVLTLGMAVDANILINERVREELRAGRNLRRALSEGYDRALSAIIDANVTSLITAVFLYQFGSGPVRGFAITLALGLLVSMFTAIYVTRTIFEWAMQNGWIKSMSMWGSGEPAKIDWVKMRRVFVPISVVGIVFGLVEFFTTDRYTLYDVDFTGGYRVTASFHGPTSVDDVKKALQEQRTVAVQHREFDDKGEPVVSEVPVVMGPFTSAEVLSVGTDRRAADIKVQRLFDDETRSSTNVTEDDKSAAFQTYLAEVLGDRLLPAWIQRGPEPYRHVAPETPEGEEPVEDPMAELDGGAYLRMTLLDPARVLSADMLQKLLETDFPHWVEEDGRQVPKAPADVSLQRKVLAKEVEGAGTDTRTYDLWIRTTSSTGQTLPMGPEELRRRLGDYLGSEGFRTALRQRLVTANAPVPDTIEVRASQPFPSNDVVGSTVAQKLKNDAMVALFLSLIGIIIYIAFRFHSKAMGFSAVLCLFHDVAATLGFVAVANQLGLVDAKINLAMVAAFLTLVGYSVNDTVVVFDRIRENRGKRPDLTPEIINLSVNQTLARSIKTSATFLLVCLALFIFNYGQRNVLEGFSFLLILGAVIGTYSTVAISAPMLLFLPWLWKRIRGFAPRSEMVTKLLTNAATLVLVPIAAVLYAAWWVVYAVVAFLIGLALFIPWSLSPEAEGGSAATA